MKSTILTTNTPYLSRKIHRICALNFTQHLRRKVLYAVSRRNPYTVFDYKSWNILEYNNRRDGVSVPALYKKPQRVKEQCVVVHDQEFDQRALYTLRRTKMTIKEEVKETMQEPTMEEYMMKTQEDYGSGIARTNIDEKAHFELKGQFLKELRDNNFSGLNNNDANEHNEKDLVIVDLFHIPEGLNMPTRQILDSKGVIPSMKAADAKKAIQDMVDHSQKCQIERQLGIEVNEKVYAAQVGCESCGGPHYIKDCLLKEEGKPFEEPYYTHIGAPFPQGGRDRAAAPGFYQRDNENPWYQVRIQKMEESLSLGELAHTKLIIELADRKIKHPKGIAENVLVGIDKFIFPVEFIVLDMPEVIKVPLILERPFLSIAHAMIDVFKRKKRMELDLEARLMREALILNRSIDPVYGDYIELNDLNEPLELRRNQVEDLCLTIKEGEVIDKPMKDIVKTRNDDNEISNELDEYPSFCDYDEKIHINCAYNLQFSCMIEELGPTIEEGEVIDEPMKDIVKTRNDDNEISNGLDEYPSFCEYDEKIHINCAYNLQFSCMIGKNVVGAFINVSIFVGNFFVVTDFAVVENMDAY
ncbi:reverse transcriptase domain-containing protein [Tanacetum coccineum]